MTHKYSNLKVALAGICCLALAELSYGPQFAFSQDSFSAPTSTGERVQRSTDLSAQAAQNAEATSNVTVIEGLDLSIWAPPGLVANALTLDLDPEGRAYVIASSRAGMLLDIRQHPDWVPEVHSLQSTEELRAFFRREMAPERSSQNEWLPDFNEDGSRDYRDLTVVAERIFRVEDTDSDGIADSSVVVHEGFNEDIASDIAGGILVDGENLYVTIAPDLWRLRDTTGDGLFDQKLSLSHGYSTHPAFSGHDMSALAIGPDGRLYWKIGDIGLNVVDDTGRRWIYPNQGAVLRSDPDGSNFEVFATGLRNTQEIAFDKYGNLISVDNDGDHAGETERVVYLVQGSDAGWRSTWQYGKYTDALNNGYNVWMAEDLSRPHFDSQAAYITPPIAPYHAGPSGFAYNPGTALSARWQDYFFVTSFTGGAANARVMAFQLEPDGAGFTLANDTQVIRGLLSSGIAFGPDGALYLTDWIQGWGATGEGLLWRLDDPATAGSPARMQVSALLNESFADKRRSELEALLAHADMRIRLRSQFELVVRGDSRLLSRVAHEHDNQLARIHGLWGLGQLARQDRIDSDDIRALLTDPDDEVRAQAAKMLGDAREAGSIDWLIDAMNDPAPRVRFFATEALGRIGATEAINPIAAMLAENDNQDVYLRTAGYHALAGIGDAREIAELAAHPSAAVRLAAVVALRRLQAPEVARFLADADAKVVTEAARAINDEGGIVDALPALAAALAGTVSDEAFVRRALSAGLRAGDATSAQRIGAFAANADKDESMRIEAIQILGVWSEPSMMDRVDGAWIGVPAGRDQTAAAPAMSGLLDLLNEQGTSAAVRVAVLESAAGLDIPATVGYAFDRLQSDTATEVRIAALNALAVFGGLQAEQGIELALVDSEPTLRMTAISRIPTMPIAEEARTAALLSVVSSQIATTGEKQSAVSALGRLNSAGATAAIEQLMEQLAQGTIEPGIRLELLETAGADSVDILADFRSALVNGGSQQRGRQLVSNHPAAQCSRCHTLGNSESDVGPDLNGIAQRLTREELLEALLDPSATIAEEFGDAAAGASAMPPMGTLMTPREIRDVVEFLATQP